MIANLKPYPATKDSGVEWLGEVPEYWDVVKLRHVLRPVVERDRPDLPLLSVVREKGVIVRDVSSRDENRNYIPEDLSNYKVARAGQFAMNKMKAWQGSYGISSQDGLVSPAYFVFAVTGVEAEFFHRAIRSKAYVPFFAQASDGVRIGQWDLSQARMREIAFSVPPLPEQGAVVRFIDYVDRRIRRYIRAKRKLIKLLEEQKQAIIHRAVTRGLDPDVPLKDSGIEWLGQVPEHWEVVPLRYLGTKFGSGITPRGGATVYQDTGVPLLRSQNVHFSGLRLEGVARISAELHESLSGTHVRPGDVLLNITGASLGRVCTTPRDFAQGNVNQHVCIIRTKKEKLVPEFLSAFLSTPGMQREIQFEQTGAAREGLTLNAIRNFMIVLPPLSEQSTIMEYLDEAIAAIDTTITRANREIDLLNEYRTRLIADVVTGKLDVREAAASLPDEPEEPEAMDDLLPENDETELDGVPEVEPDD